MKKHVKPALTDRTSIQRVFLAEPLEQRLLLSVSLINDVNTVGAGASAAPKTLGVFKDRLYFFANDGIHGFEPWSTDGTPGGASLLKDLFPGSGNGTVSNTETAIATSQYLFFTGRDAQTSTTELWRTDGTPEGTIKLLSQGATRGWGVIGNTVYFVPGKVSAIGLWSSDGTPEGTHAVPGGGSITSIARSLDGILYCIGSDATFGTELWRSDGTADGTYRLTDLNPGAADSLPAKLSTIGHTLLFFAYDVTSTTNLYKYTSDAGVTLVKDINPGANDDANNVVAVANGKLFFGSTNSTTGSALWTSDGTPDGTTMLDMTAGKNSFSPSKLFALNDIVIFNAAGQLYRSDGTAGGTYPLGTVLPASSTMVNAPTFVTLGNYAYYAGLVNKVESIWRTDGISGISMVADMATNLQGPGPTFTNLPSQMIAFNGALYFSANDGVTGNEYWTYTPDNTPLSPVMTFDPKTGLKLQFDRPLANDSVRTTRMSFKIISNGALIIDAFTLVTIDYAAGAVNITFPGYANGILPTGNYQIHFPAGNLHDVFENPLPTDYYARFFIQAGDANQDRSVDFADLVAVAQNYGLSSNATYANGDFNGDGAVDFADLVTIAQNYGKTLAPPLAAPPIPSLPIAAPELLASAKSKPQNSKLTLFNTKAPIRPTKPAKPKQLITRR